MTVGEGLAAKNKNGLDGQQIIVAIRSHRAARRGTEEDDLLRRGHAHDSLYDVRENRRVRLAPVFSRFRFHCHSSAMPRHTHLVIYPESTRDAMRSC